MKHNIGITLLLLAMFLVTQLIGLAVIQAYSPHIEQTVVNGTLQNVTVQEELPYGMQPPEMEPEVSLTSILIGIILATLIIFLLRRMKARLLLKLWFFFVVALSIAIVFNSALSKILPVGEVQLLAFALAFPVAFYKIFERNIIVHNLTELLVYPGIAVIFVPLLNIWTGIALLVAIALYDIYAVWHSGFMQKLAKFQIQQLHIFTGFFVPYVAKKDRARIKRMRMMAKKGKLKDMQIKVNLAILGGGDVTFPLIFAGVILRASGLWHALFISLIASAALFMLFVLAKKGKFYPAMLFLSPACILAWLIGLMF